MGYGIGSRLLEISRDGDAVTQSLVWESTRLKAKFTNPVLHDGFVYGLDDGVLVCLDPANGERRWKGGRYGHGQTILIGNRLLVQTEDGEIVLVDPRPDAHHAARPFQRLRSEDLEPTGARRSIPVSSHGYGSGVLRAGRVSPSGCVRSSARERAPGRVPRAKPLGKD